MAYSLSETEATGLLVASALGNALLQYPMGWIADHVDQQKFDVIVVDAAPTGETLRLLSLPEASRWWVERIAPIGSELLRPLHGFLGFDG